MKQYIIFLLALGIASVGLNAQTTSIIKSPPLSEATPEEKIIGVIMKQT